MLFRSHQIELSWRFLCPQDPPVSSLHQQLISLMIYPSSYHAQGSMTFWDCVNGHSTEAHYPMDIMSKLGCFPDPVTFMVVRHKASVICPTSKFPHSVNIISTSWILCHCTALPSFAANATINYLNCAIQVWCSHKLSWPYTLLCIIGRWLYSWCFWRPHQNSANTSTLLFNF